jgi:hypothetical protein
VRLVPASVHIGDGIARIGGVVLPARPAAAGLVLGDDAVLRPVSFGLRSRLVAWSGDGLAEAILAEMLSGTAEGLDRLAVQALALHLAGAESGAPGFRASAALLARLLGRPLAEINAGDALEMDQLAAALCPPDDQADHGGWTRVVFAPGGQPGGGEESVVEICNRLVADLRRRGSESVSAAEMTAIGAAPSGREHREWREPRLFGDPEGSGAGLPLPAADQSSAGRGLAPVQFDPPPDPWKDQSRAPGQAVAFAAAAVPPGGLSGGAADPAGPGAAVASLSSRPAVAGNLPPSGLAGWQARPSASPDERRGVHTPKPAQPASLPLPGEGVRPPDGGFAPRLPPRSDSFLPLSQSPVMGSGLAVAFADPQQAPSRASLFWQSVTAPDGSAPRGQVAAEPVPDLDSIADALHAIADLRGVAR